MIYGYHNNRSWTDVSRSGDNFFKTDRNGHIRAIAPENAGAALYEGWELETDGYDDDDDAEYVSDRVDEMRGEYCHCEHDGSLDTGFEIITQPMTLAAHKAANWGEMLDKISELGGHSHDTDTCGLHVHVSRAALGNDDDARTLCIAKILEFVERFQQELSCFARRDITSCNWARRTNYGYSPNDSSRTARRKARAVQSSQGFNCHDDRRYKCVNLQNAKTVEFRFFKGTLSPRALYATLALVDGLVRFCKTHTTPDVHTVTWLQFLTFVNDETLTAYWGQRVNYLHRFAPYVA